ncbi:MAG TPA: NAD(P)-dependent oxidoreductase [Acidimicrobiia bacterium]
MKVLVTGAAGFFGRSLVREFALSGEEVVAADILAEDQFSPRSDTPSSVSYIRLDVADKSSWTNPALGDVDGVVHAAALTPTVEESQHDPTKLIDVNLVGLLNGLEFARTNEVKKFLFISSGGVYNQFVEEELVEEDGDGGFSLYGSAKLAAEIMMFRYAKMFGFDAGAVRPTSMYGPAEEFRDTRPFVTEVKLLAEAAAEGRPVRGERVESRCDWVYVDDVSAAAYKFFATGMNGRVFNLTSGNPRPFADVLSAAESIFGLEVRSDAETVVDGGPDRPTIISPAKAKAALGWTPIPLEEGLQRFADAIGLSPK